MPRVQLPSGPDLSGVINEDFLNAPSARQRDILQAATGDKRFLRLPEEDLHRFIASAINEIGARPARGPVYAEESEASTDPQLLRAMHQAADANDPELANSILRSARLRNAAQSRGRSPRTAQSAANTRSLADDPAGGVARPTLVPTVDRRGGIHNVPSDQLPEAVQAGHRVVMPMTHPNGTHGYVPVEETSTALRRGFRLGHQSADGEESDAPQSPQPVYAQPEEQADSPAQPGSFNAAVARPAAYGPQLLQAAHDVANVNELDGFNNILRNASQGGAASSSDAMQSDGINTAFGALAARPRSVNVAGDSDDSLYKTANQLAEANDPEAFNKFLQSVSQSNKGATSGSPLPATGQPVASKAPAFDRLGELAGASSSDAQTTDAPKIWNDLISSGQLNKVQVQLVKRPIQYLTEKPLEAKFAGGMQYHTYFKIIDPDHVLDKILGAGTTENGVYYHTYGVVGEDATSNDQQVRKDILRYSDKNDKEHIAHWKNSGAMQETEHYPARDSDIQWAAVFSDIAATPQQKAKLIQRLEYFAQQTKLREAKQPGEECPSCGEHYRAFFPADLVKFFRRDWDGYNSNTFTYNMLDQIGVKPPDFAKVPGYHKAEGNWYEKQSDGAR